MKRIVVILLIVVAFLLAVAIYLKVEPAPTSKRGFRIAEKFKAEAAKDSLNNIQAMKHDSIASIEREKKIAEEAYNNRPWQLFVFGEDRDSRYIKFNTKGTFTNSAVKDEDLFVKIYVSKNDIGLFLYEYDSTRPAEKFIGKGALIISNSNGQELIVFLTESWSHSEGIRINNETDYYNVVNFLKRSNGKIDAYVQDDYSSTYLFKIDVMGFSREYSLL